MTPDRIDVLARLTAMRSREATTSYVNYFDEDTPRGDIDEACREAIVTWLTRVQEALSFEPETVWIAMSFFDRYLSSGKGNSHATLASKCQFQLAAITAFYTAVKIYEPVVLDVDMLVQICRGSYRNSDIIGMEQDLLSALNWRVAVHTPMDVARCLVELLPARLSPRTAEQLLEACQRHVRAALSDVAFLPCAPSAVGLGCLRRALRERPVGALHEEQTPLATWADVCRAEALSKGARAAPPPLPLRTAWRDSTVRVSKFADADSDEGGWSSSFTCVIRAAQQA